MGKGEMITSASLKHSEHTDIVWNVCDLPLYKMYNLPEAEYKCIIYGPVY